jgi:hypothetical protein
MTAICSKLQVLQVDLCKAELWRCEALTNIPEHVNEMQRKIVPMHNRRVEVLLHALRYYLL